MRNFIYAKSVATSGLVSAGASGAFGVAYLDATGAMKFDDGSHIKDKGYLVLCRDAKQGGNVVLPFYKKNYRYARSVYAAAKSFASSIELPSSVMPGVDYTVLVVKKGVKFNERNRWHASVRAKSSFSMADIANDLVKQINAMSDTLGLVATYVPANSSNAAKISFVAASGFEGFDFKILGADELIDAPIVGVTAGAPARNDAAMIVDLADKAAADAGFEYTYMGDVHYMYPDYPLHVAKAADLTDPGFTVYTIFFAEPREVKTVDEVINQIVQVAFNASNHSALVAVLDALK